MVELLAELPRPLIDCLSDDQAGTICALGLLIVIEWALEL